MLRADPTLRTFLGQLGACALSLAARAAAPANVNHPLIDSIEKMTLLRGRDGRNPTWFHPRACMIPGVKGATAFMTLQTIGGSDYFGPVHWMTSQDLGRTWTAPRPVPALGRVPMPDGAEEGVCDTVPEYHAKTNSVLALGHSVVYRGPKFSRDQPPRWPVYAVWKDGQWSERQKLEWEDPRGAYIYTNNCGQRVTLDNGDIQFVMTFGDKKDGTRLAAGVRASFDGKTLSIRKVGTPMRHEKGRGLLEPSLVKFRGKFYATIRAEDERGYVAVSDDGLEFEEKRPWCWDNGEPLGLSTTQQHWLAHSDALFLVYTRKDVSNTKVMRWRSPLWMAQMDTSKLCLIKETERVVLPLIGEGVSDPDHVALMGNFHITNASPRESWVTVGEWMPKNGARGDLLLARIGWSKENRLAARA